MELNEVLEKIGIGGLLLVAILAGMASFWVLSWIQKVNLKDEIVNKNNSALGIRFAAFMLALGGGFSQVIDKNGDFGENVGHVALYGSVFIIVMIVAYIVNDKLILYHWDNNREVVAQQNIAVAIVEGSTYLATAFIASATVIGIEQNLTEAISWLLIGQILLVLFAYVYNLLIPKTHEALDNGNIACALSLGGFLFTLGVILWAAVSGESTTWGEDLTNVSLYLAGWVVVVAIMHIVADYVAITGANLRHEIMEQTSVASGVIEGVFFVIGTLLYINIIA